MTDKDAPFFYPTTSTRALDRRRFLVLSTALSLAAVTGYGATAQQTAKPAWTADNIPSQEGRTIVITGGNGVPSTILGMPFPPPGVYSGLGFQDARALTKKGANVIIASRNADKGRDAVALIQSEHPGARIRFEQLDLADLASVRAFSDRLGAQFDRIDVLINNAATAGTPERKVNAAGHELCWPLIRSDISASQPTFTHF